MKKKTLLSILLISLVLSGCVPLNSSSNSSSATPDDVSDSSGTTEETKFTITWKNYDETILKVDENVLEGTLPIYEGDDPTRNSDEQYSYVFSGWSPTVVPVTSSAIYVAIYELLQNKYTITWKNYDGTVLETDNDVVYGTKPTFDSDNPIRESDEWTLYIFNGWSPEIVATTGDTTYTAIFKTLNRGDKLENGLYPQSKVNDQELIASLNDQSGLRPTPDNSRLWKSYKYYIESSNNDDFMWYIDIAVGKELYRGVYFTSYRPRQTVLSSSTSNSYQDDSGYYLNTRYWFKFEPILWDVLSVNENTGPLLLSSKIIDGQEYYHLDDEVRIINGQTIYPNNYKESNVRTWLNNSFLNTAFSAIEQISIRTTNIDNSAYSAGIETNEYETSNTDDKLFLLSYREVVNVDYGFSTSIFLDDFRQRSTTDYAKAMGVYVQTLGVNSYWWLRSPYSDYPFNVRSVNYGGRIDYSVVRYAVGGILPAFRINI